MSSDDIYKQLLQERAKKLEQKRQTIAVLPPPPPALAAVPSVAVLRPSTEPVIASTLPRLPEPSVVAKESVFARLGQSRDIFAEPPLSPLPEERKRKTVSGKKKPIKNPKRIFIDQYALEHPNLASDPQRLLQEASSAYTKLSKDDILLLQDEADRQQKADLLALQMQQWQAPQPLEQPPAKKRRVAKSAKPASLQTEPQGDFESNLAAILGLSSSSSSSSSTSFNQ